MKGGVTEIHRDFFVSEREDTKRRINNCFSQALSLVKGEKHPHSHSVFHSGFIACGDSFNTEKKGEDTEIHRDFAVGERKDTKKRIDNCFSLALSLV